MWENKPFQISTWLLLVHKKAKNFSADENKKLKFLKEKKLILDDKNLSKQIDKVELKINEKNLDEENESFVARQWDTSQLYAFACVSKLFDLNNQNRHLYDLTFSDFSKEIPLLKKLDTKAEQRAFLKYIYDAQNIQVEVKYNVKNKGKITLSKTKTQLFQVSVSDSDDDLITKLSLFPWFTDEEAEKISFINIPNEILSLKPAYKGDKTLNIAMYISEYFGRNTKKDSFKTSFEKLYEVANFSKNTVKIKKKNAIISYLEKLVELNLIWKIKNLSSIEDNQDFEIKKIN